MITVLCIDSRGFYPKLAEKYDLDLWDIKRDAYKYKGSNPVICHAPCQQWSKLKAFATPDPYSKNLAFHCWDIVQSNGGIFEHPVGSSFFKIVNPTYKRVYRVNQSDFGFFIKKPTLLYFSKIKPLPYPLNFEAKNLRLMESTSKQSRSLMTLGFAEWLIQNVLQLNNNLNETDTKKKA